MGLAWSCSKEVFGATSHYESYAYTTVQDYGAWSVRRYVAAVAAETDSTDGDDKMFIRLARYIGVFATPENQQANTVAMTTPVVSQPIAMTTPVVSSAGSAEASIMRFILPSQYQQVEDAPVPTNPSVRLVVVPERQMAVLSFSGRCNGDDEATTKYKDLIEHMACTHNADGSEWKAAGQWELHRHNPPYTLGMFRTNEILVPVVLKGDGSDNES